MDRLVFERSSTQILALRQAWPVEGKGVLKESRAHAAALKHHRFHGSFAFDPATWRQDGHIRKFTFTDGKAAARSLYSRVLKPAHYRLTGKFSGVLQVG